MVTVWCITVPVPWSWYSSTLTTSPSTRIV